MVLVVGVQRAEGVEGARTCLSLFVAGSKRGLPEAIMTIWERTFRAAVRRAPGPELVALHGSAAPRWDRENTHTQPQTRPTPTTSRPSKRVVPSPSRPQHRKNPLPPGPVASLNPQRQEKP